LGNFFKKQLVCHCFTARRAVKPIVAHPKRP
jgi:hypothetical protein